MEDPALSKNFVDAAALRRYNFFKGLILVLLAALLLSLWSFTRQFAAIQAPTLTGPDGIVSPGSLTLNGRGTPNSDIDLQMNGASIGTTMVDAAGRWSLNTDLAAGEYEFIARALDPDGVERGRSAGLTVNVAESVVYTAPTLTLPSGDVAVAAVPFSGTGTPSSTVELFNNGAAVGTAVVNPDGRWSLNVPINRYMNELEAFGFDPHGADIGSSGARPFMLKAAAAALNLNAPDLGEFSLGDAGLPQAAFGLTGTGEPNTQVQLSLDDLDLGMVNVDAAGNWVFSGDLSLEPGTYNWQARMLSADGLELGMVEHPGLVVPALATAPTLVAETDAAGGRVWRGTALPNALVEIVVNGQVVATVIADADGSWSWVPDLELGEYEVVVRSGDDPHLTGDSQTVTVGQPSGALQLLLAGSAVGDGQPGTAPAGSPVIEIILDASGSMMEPLADTTRFETARTALQTITDNVLPDETPLAVRAFGNIEGNYACRTDLMIPYQPLDRESMNAFLAEVAPQVNANTPIADSLARVPFDLADAGDRDRIIILLTDGEETCGGDPAAQIQKLRDAGVEVQVNIVGLAVADDALKTEFERWAAIGGGQYFDVSEPGHLIEVLREAVLVPYVVRDAAGELVVIGRVGGQAQSLPVGTYTVAVQTAPPVILTMIEIVGDETLQLTLDE